MGNGALGPTHYRLDPDVLVLAHLIGREFPNTRWNTYVAHPWPGWDGRSFDVWGPGGRGSPIDLSTGHRIVRRLFNLPGAPWIRHYIYLNTLWTSYGGSSWWQPSDHSGSLRHVHVTYWR